MPKDRPMRIAMITETYPPEINGVAMTLRHLVDGLAELGHDVEVIRPKQNKDDVARQEEPMPGHVEHVPLRGLPIPRYDGLKFGLPAQRRLMKRWKQQKPDVTHIATEGPLGVTAMRAARKLGIPVTSSFHTNFHEYGKHYGYGLLARMVIKYLRWVHAHATCTLVPSQDIVDALVADKFENVHILARGVDTKLFSPERRSQALRQEWGIADDELVVGYVGRVAEEKNIPLTAEAYSAMREVDPKLKLVIVGDGPAMPGLKKKYPDAVYAGMRTGEDLAAHYASCDMFVFGSVTETFGNVVIEAMASGLAVLAYDYAAPKRYIQHGQNGMLATFDDKDDFIAKARELADDRDRVQKMGVNARRTVDGHSWAAIIHQYEALLYDVAENGKMTKPTAPLPPADIPNAEPLPALSRTAE